MAKIEKAYFSVGSQRPWKNAGEHTAAKYTGSPTVYDASVARVCLECTAEKCLYHLGCEKYKAAVKDVTANRVNHNVKTWSRPVTVGGVTKGVGVWAKLLHISAAALYNRARANGRTLEEEIELRLKERAK